MNNRLGGFAMMLRWMGISILIGAALPVGAQSAGSADLNAAAERQLPALVEVYKHLHENPELSGHEVKTAAFMAGELRKEPRLGWGHPAMALGLLK